jgi:hypothetical protein
MLVFGVMCGEGVLIAFAQFLGGGLWLPILQLTKGMES